jgi:cytochrome P450
VTVSYAPLDPAFSESPWEVYRLLRDQHPVYQDPVSGAYFLSRFDDVQAAALDWRTFGSEPPTGHRDHFASMDPPQHDRHRAKVYRLFTPRAVAARAESIQQICADLIAPLRNLPRFDVIADFAALLPNAVISRLVGVPPEIEETFRLQALQLAETTGTPEYADAMTALEDTARRMVTGEYEPLPGGIAATLLDDPDPLSADEIVGLVTNLVLAGTDTVTNLLGSAVALLAERPQLCRRLAADPRLLSATIEEVLRLESPVQLLFRHTRAPVLMHGVQIPSGAEIRLLWGAANRDDRIFAQPDHFLPGRPMIRHLAFGHGLHFCLGAALARQEATIALRASVSFLDTMTVDRAAALRLRSMVFRGFESLPLIRAAG